MAGKRVLLVHPEISKKKQDFIGIIENEPLELEYFAAALKEKGYDVAIFDIAREAKSLEDMLREFEPHYFYICGRLKNTGISLLQRTRRIMITFIWYQNQRSLG